MSLIVSLVAVAVLIGPTIAAYLIVPPEVLAAWPAMAVSFIPLAAALLACLVVHGWRPQLEAPLPTTAAAWLQAEIARLGTIGIGVAAMAKGRDQASFFHPATNTIVLADDVFGEHSANAHATAAHELGHALFCLERPRLAALFMTARGTASGWFEVGAGLLVGAVVAGGRAIAIAAIAAFVIAAILHALVVVEEAVASQHALALLRPHLTAPEHAPAAGRDLRRALATYGLQLVGAVAAVVVAAWLARQPTGVLLDGPAPIGAAAIAATVGAVVAVLAGLAAVAGMLPAPDRAANLLTDTVQVLGLATCPLLAALLCDQAGAPAWAVAMAAAPAWSMMSVPAKLAPRRLVATFDRALASATVPLPPGVEIRRVDRARMIAAQEPHDRADRLPAALMALAPVPLALWWLL